jgi:hypothetical protein
LYFRIYALRYLEEIFRTTRRRRFVEGMKVPSSTKYPNLAVSTELS